MRKRAGALLIRDKKLLMLTGPKADFFWTPGGKLDDNESYTDALVRELEEELHVTPHSIKLYHRFSSSEEVLNGYLAPESQDEYFLVETADQLQPDREIDTAIWASREDLARMPLLNKFRDNIITKLTQENLI